MFFFNGRSWIETSCCIGRFWNFETPAKKWSFVSAGFYRMQVLFCCSKYIQWFKCIKVSLMICYWICTPPNEKPFLQPPHTGVSASPFPHHQLLTEITRRRRFSRDYSSQRIIHGLATALIIFHDRSTPPKGFVRILSLPPLITARSILIPGKAITVEKHPGSSKQQQTNKKCRP